MKNKILKILDFCSILSYDGRLSITNLAVIALIVKLVISPSPDLSTVGATAIALFNYIHKRSSTPDEKTGPDNQEPSHPA